MSAFDSNRDGFLDASERQDAQEFARGDVNHDGALNLREFARIEGSRLKRIAVHRLLFAIWLDPRKFQMYDTNRDGLVDAPEYAQGERRTEHPCKSAQRKSTRI